MLTLIIVAGLAILGTSMHLRAKAYRKVGKRDPLAPLLSWGIGVFTGAGLLFALFLMFHHRVS